MNQAININQYFNQDQYNRKNTVLFFAYDKLEGVTGHCFNMAVASGRYADLMVVYDKSVELDRVYLNKLQERMECVDISELKQVISSRFRNKPLLFHCNGFVHLRIAKRLSRPMDKILLTVHGFRNSQRKGKWVALLTYLLYSRSVDLWHFLSIRSREEYFWFKRCPSNTCVFPLGVEQLLMEKPTKVSVVRDLSGKEVPDISNKVNIVYIARFQPWKRHRFLLRSLCPILRDNTYLYLLGEGALLSKVMKMAAQMGIRNNVIFTGYVDRYMVHYILDNASLAVGVSVTETFGWFLVEPYCMDVPIVTTNVGIAGSIIRDYCNGFILPTKCTKKEFLDKTIEALRLYKRVDNSGTKKLYAWNNYGESVVKSYESLMQPREA